MNLAPQRHRLSRLSKLMAILSATAACAANPRAGTEQVPRSDLKPQTQIQAAPASQNLWRQIQAEVGDAECDGTQQCHSIAIGAKACGGPDSYLAWSSKRSDGKQLRSLVEQHAAARKAENLAAQKMSDCRLVTDSGASCQAGRCTLNPANASPGSHLAQ